MGKTIVSLKKLAKMAKERALSADRDQLSQEVCLLKERYGEGRSLSSLSSTTPTGFFPVYVGEGRQRFLVPTAFLSHPLFKMLLEKAREEFGFEHRNGLTVLCSVPAFREVLNAVEGCNGKFEFGELVEEFV
ncbi:auxin-responsive protein SAUR21-like [Rhodamnia argentea]|uniref:Auxin-responsive protein SAUR21-like n=1 Tax=Rhodamnia argentea TaxID=178133 RepID=A0A8B8PCK9_9MYRT|nr:auxin-responsive protein SAUR21-like [Rhodamnia argentea]